jgi:hypothetical protein
MSEASGHSVAFLVSGGDIIIRRSGQDIRLSAAERDTFIRLFTRTELQAETWTREQAAEVVDAEILCGYPECPFGPADHLLTDACEGWPDEPGPAS